MKGQVENRGPDEETVLQWSQAVSTSFRVCFPGKHLFDPVLPYILSMVVVVHAGNFYGEHSSFIQLENFMIS